jgi:putative ABC transport system permease protein
MVLLTVLTPLSFFFVRFSIDGNIAASTGQYRTALGSNTVLAYNFFAAMTGLTAFVFCIFFYRFFRSCKKQMGCLKALGFKDDDLMLFFVIFTATLSLLGGVISCVLGYPMSNILIRANMETYSVTGLVRSLNVSGVLFGILGQTAAFGLTAFLCYGFVRGKEPGALIAGNQSAADSRTLRAANAVTNFIPIKDKFPLRIALRKPLAMVLVLTAVMSFSTCVIIGRSLNVSSRTVFESQTLGHEYKYDVRYSSPQYGNATGVKYLEVPGPEYSTIGLYGQGELFILLDADGKQIDLPEPGYRVIGHGIAEMYGLRQGDTIAFNAKTKSVYVNAEELAASLGLAIGAYNGIYCDALPENTDGAKIVMREQRIEQLNRDAVSNNISGVINQAIGVLVGCILFFLGLYINFQDNTRDMLILHMMGYRVKAIRKMLIDIYRPLVWFCFIITLPASIWLVQLIQRNLSTATGDYMPFSVDIIVILTAFVSLTLLYQLVQWTFGAAIRRVIASEDIAEYTNAE